MWKCPVCETEYGDVTACPRCGFDGSCDYEHYPTVFAVAGVKSTRALRREWEQKQGPGMEQLLWNWFVKTQEQPGISTWWVLLSCFWPFPATPWPGTGSPARPGPAHSNLPGRAGRSCSLVRRLCGTNGRPGNNPALSPDPGNSDIPGHIAPEHSPARRPYGTT